MSKDFFRHPFKTTADAYADRQSRKRLERKAYIDELISNATIEKNALKLVHNIETLDEFKNDEVHNKINNLNIGFDQSKVQSEFNKLRIKYFKEALAKCDDKGAFIILLTDDHFKLFSKFETDPKYLQEYQNQLKLFGAGTLKEEASKTVENKHPKRYDNGGEIFELIQDKLFNLFIKDFGKSLKEIQDGDETPYKQLQGGYDNILNGSPINRIDFDRLKDVFKFRAEKRWNNYYHAQIEIVKLEDEIRIMKGQSDNADTLFKENEVRNRKILQNTEVGILQSVRDWERPQFSSIKDQWSYWDWIGMVSMIAILGVWAAGVGLGKSEIAIIFLVTFLVLLIFWFSFKIFFRTSKGDFGAFRSFFFVMLLFSVMFCMTIGFSRTNVGDQGIYTILGLDIALGAISLFFWTLIILKLNGRAWLKQPEMFIREFKPDGRSKLEQLHSEIVKDLSDGKNFEPGTWNKVKFWGEPKFASGVKENMDEMKKRAAQICLTDMGEKGTVKNVNHNESNGVYTIETDQGDVVVGNNFDTKHYYYAIVNIDYIATGQFIKTSAPTPVTQVPINDIKKRLNLLNIEDIDTKISEQEEFVRQAKAALEEDVKANQDFSEKLNLYIDALGVAESYRIFKDIGSQDFDENTFKSQIETSKQNIITAIRDIIPDKGKLSDKEVMEHVEEHFKSHFIL